MDYIPVDDIMTEYGGASEEKKSAITNLLRGSGYLSVVVHDKKGQQVTLDWQAGPPMSIHLLLGVVATGRNEFGRVWLDDLKNKISQLT